MRVCLINSPSQVTIGNARMYILVADIILAISMSYQPRTCAVEHRYHKNFYEPSTIVTIFGKGRTEQPPAARSSTNRVCSKGIMSCPVQSPASFVSEVISSSSSSPSWSAQILFVYFLVFHRGQNTALTPLSHLLKPKPSRASGRAASI